MNTYTKRAEEIIRIQFDWTVFLASVGNDAISEVQYLADDGIVFTSTSVVGSVVTVYIAGGVATAGYNFGVTIATVGGAVETDIRRLRVRSEVVGDGAIEFDGGDSGTTYTPSGSFELDGGDAEGI